MKPILCTAALGAAVLLSACGHGGPTVAEVLNTSRQIAERSYADAARSADALQQAVQDLIDEPSHERLQLAREAWRAARVPYSQSEALRFGHWFVDAWEGQVNAWPVDEGFLDYVQAPYLASPSNPQARLNLVAAARIRIGERELDSERITPLLLRNLQNLGDFEANVATGYHAIEFLLWGQDLNAHGPGAGERPWTDFAADTRCTDGPQAAPIRHCRRRAEILQSLLEQLRRDLHEMHARWLPTSGSYGDRWVQGEPKQGLRRLLFAMASMSGQELAGERLQVALLSQAPEEEQDCFSDDTQHSVYFNARGVANFYFGRYQDEQIGPGLRALLHAQGPAPLVTALDQAFVRSERALAAIRDSEQAFDQLIAPQNAAGHALLQAAIDALLEQTAALQEAGVVLDLGALNPAALQ